jgi:hypothetical protein
MILLLDTSMTTTNKMGVSFSLSTLPVYHHLPGLEETEAEAHSGYLKPYYPKFPFG